MKQNFRSKFPSRCLAFSLVEVALALGLVTIAMVAIMGLLPVGLQSVRNAGEHAGAAMVASSLAEQLRTAAATDTANPRKYSSRFAGQTFGFEAGGGAGTVVRWNALTLEGGDADGPALARLSAVLQVIEPPADLATPGRAVISVAWSARSNPEWENGKWQRAEGEFTIPVQFLPGS